MAYSPERWIMSVAACGLLSLVGAPALAADESADESADDADVFDLYGWSVAADGDRLVVGAPGDNEGGLNAGAVYVYSRRGDSWGLSEKLISDTPRPFTYFGAALALSGDLLIVGAPNDYNRRTSAQGPGEVHVYRRDGRSFDVDAVLTAEPATLRDRFGAAVATDGERIIVGASRLYYENEVHARAFIFADKGGWGLDSAPLESSLPWVCLPTFASDPCMNPAYSFGGSVAIDGEWAMIGDPARDDTTVYRREADGWTEHSHIAESSILSIADDVATLSGRLYGLAADEGAWNLLTPDFAGTAPTVVAHRDDLAVVATTILEDPEVVLHYDLYRNNGGAWSAEASLMDDEPGRSSRYNQRPSAVSATVVAFGRPQTDLNPEVEGVGEYAGQVKLFGIDGTPLDPLTADSEGCGCTTAPAPTRGAAGWLGLLALAALLRGRRRQATRRALGRRLSTPRGAPAAVVAALTATVVLAAPSSADACSSHSPGYIFIGEGTPELTNIPTDGAFVLLLSGNSKILEDLDEVLELSVTLDGAPVAGEFDLKVLFDVPRYHELDWTSVLVIWRPETGALTPESTYSLSLSYPLASGHLITWDREATTAAGTMGPLTPPEATIAELTPIEVSGEAEVCCESPSTDSCSEYYWCTFTLRHDLPGIVLEAAPTMSPGDAAVTRAFVAVEGPGGELEEVVAISPRMFINETTIHDPAGIAGELVFDDAQANYCLTLGAENLATGELVYGAPICLEHGELAAPASRDVGVANSFLSWCGEHGTLYDAESGLPLDPVEPSSGCSVAGEPRSAGGLALLVLGLGLAAGRRRRR